MLSRTDPEQPMSTPDELRELLDHANRRVADLTVEVGNLRRALSRVEQDRDLQHAHAKDLQGQLDRERAKHPLPVTTGSRPSPSSAG